MTKTYADQCLERAEKAHKHLCEICKNPKAFTMCIPVHKNDSDMILQAPIDDVEELARRLKRACEMLKALRFNSAEVDELEAPLESEK